MFCKMLSRAFTGVLVLLAFLPVAIFANHAQAAPHVQPARFVSDWLVLPAGGCLDVQHGLPQRPNELFIWVRLSMDKAPAADYAAQPYLDVPYQPVEVMGATHTFIEICSRGPVDLMIQVIAAP